MALPSYSHDKYLYEILSAKMHGKEIEFRAWATKEWQSMDKYTKANWNFTDYEFRVKPEPNIWKENTK